MASIGIDIDEVLSQTVQAYIDFYNAKYGASFTFDQVSIYSFQKVFGISPEQEMQLHKEFFTSKFSEDLNEVPGSVESIKELAKNNRLYPITSRPDWQKEQTENWLSKHYGGSFEPTVFTNSHFDKSSLKSTICTAMKLDYFIEDAIVYANDCATACSKVFLLDRPWNRSELNNNNIIRVNDWSEIVDYINNHSST